MDLPASFNNLREFFSKHQFIYLPFSFFFYCIISLCLFSLVDSISGFLVKMNASLLFSSYPSFLLTLTIYVRIILQIELLAVLSISTASLLKSLVQISVSDAEHKIELSFKYTLSRAIESAKCLIFTRFYVSFFKLGYIWVGILVLLPQVLNIKIQDISDLSAICGENTILVALALLGTALYMYLAVVWNLALVVSFRENKSGIEAFRSASKLAEEMKLKMLAGFFINIVFGVFSVIVFVLVRANMKLPMADAIRHTPHLLSAVITNEGYIWMLYSIFHAKCSKNREAAMQSDVGLEHNISPQYHPLVRRELA